MMPQHLWLKPKKMNLSDSSCLTLLLSSVWLSVTFAWTYLNCALKGWKTYLLSRRGRRRWWNGGERVDPFLPALNAVTPAAAPLGSCIVLTMNIYTYIYIYCIYILYIVWMDVEDIFSERFWNVRYAVRESSPGPEEKQISKHRANIRPNSKSHALKY